MNEALKDWIARIAAETQRRADWLEFEAADGSARLVGGDIACHADRVEFEDDSGFIAELAYVSILAVRTGRQGEAGGGLRRVAPAPLDSLAA